MKHPRHPSSPMSSSSPRLAAVASLLAAAALGALAPAAQARNVRLMESVPDANRTTRVHEILGTLDLRFGGASAAQADILRHDVTVTGTGATKLNEIGDDDKVRPADHELCARAYEDAITQLAFAARGVRATAIVGVVSNYEGTLFDDPEHYECHAGTIKAYVTLRAQLARGPVAAVPVVSPPPVVSPAPAPEVVSPPPAPVEVRPAPTFQPLPPAPAPAPSN